MLGDGVKLLVATAEPPDDPNQAAATTPTPVPTMTAAAVATRRR